MVTCALLADLKRRLERPNHMLRQKGFQLFSSRVIPCEALAHTPYKLLKKTIAALAGLDLRFPLALSLSMVYLKLIKPC